MQFIFDKKDFYLSQFEGGHNASIHIPKRGNQMFPGENLHLTSGFEYTQTNGFPMLQPYNGPIDYEYVSYMDRKRFDGSRQAIHFFLYDYRFNSLWNKLDQRTYEMSGYRLLLTPDYSLGVDVPVFCNKKHIYMARFVGSYWQHCGFDVLPTASWGNADSFNYCFEGLPEQSVIAVCGVGHHKSRAHHELWKEGLRELERQKHPTGIVIYGEEENVEGIHTPMHFLETFINKKFRK